MGTLAQRVVTGKAVFGDLKRDYRVTIGGPAVYRVEPLNPKVSKDRGRTCYIAEYDGRAGLVEALFHDTERRAWIDPADLVPDAQTGVMPEIVVVKRKKAVAGRKR